MEQMESMDFMGNKIGNPLMKNIDHVQKLYDAVVAEREWEKQQHQQQLKYSYDERIEIGVSWPSVRLKSFRELYFGSILMVEQVSKSILHDGISEGDSVLIHPISTYKSALYGRCVFVEDEYSEIRISHKKKDIELPYWIQNGAFVITKNIDEATYSSYEKGLQFAMRHEFPIKEVLLQPWSPKVEVKAYEHEYLNKMQQIAVGEALDDINGDKNQKKESKQNLVTVIHGPPGTGKTHTLAILISICIQQGERPWALADSNAAADNIVRALLRLGVDVLRLGSEYRIASDVYDMSLQGRLQNHPQQDALRILEKEISKSTGRSKGLLYKERREMIKNMERGILQSGQVIVSTLGTMSRRAKDLPPTKRMIIDEATQAIEPAIWSVLPYTERLVLMGDPHQLGPVVHQPYLQKSLLQRLIEQSIQSPPMLNIQHRMSQKIMEMVTDIYGATYKTSQQIQNQKIEKFSQTSFWNSRTRIFLDTAGFDEGEQRDPISHSLYNVTELEIIVQVVEQLQKQGVVSNQISVITPYRAQVAKLKQKQELTQIEVTTINAFQGREQDIVLCSFVRSNLNGELGFVRDERRLTVALTRARKLFIGIGDSATLAIHPRYANLFDLLGEDLHSMWLGLEK